LKFVSEFPAGCWPAFRLPFAAGAIIVGVVVVVGVVVADVGGGFVIVVGLLL
jgi:hypothetical protein